MSEWLFKADDDAVKNGNGKAQEIVKAPTIKVLVALNNLPAGTIVNPDLFLWQNWPKEGLAENYIVQGKDDKKNAVKPADLTGWAVRRGITKGQPITKNRLLEPGKAGFLAGVLSQGGVMAPVEVEACGIDLAPFEHSERRPSAADAPLQATQTEVVNMRELSAEDAAEALLTDAVTPNLPEDGATATVNGEKKI